MGISSGHNFMFRHDLPLNNDNSVFSEDTQRFLVDNIDYTHEQNFNVPSDDMIIKDPIATYHYTPIFYERHKKMPSDKVNTLKIENSALTETESMNEEAGAFEKSVQPPPLNEFSDSLFENFLDSSTAYYDNFTDCTKKTSFSFERWRNTLKEFPNRQTSQVNGDPTDYGVVSPLIDTSFVNAMPALGIPDETSVHIADNESLNMDALPKFNLLSMTEASQGPLVDLTSTPESHHISSSPVDMVISPKSNSRSAIPKYPRSTLLSPRPESGFKRRYNFRYRHDIGNSANPPFVVDNISAKCQGNEHQQDTNHRIRRSFHARLQNAMRKKDIGIVFCQQPDCPTAGRPFRNIAEIRTHSRRYHPSLFDASN